MHVGLEERRLRRIIATLVALAVLAERAAYRAFPVRWLVLCLLRHAEAVVRDHVAETTGWDWPDLGQAFGIDSIGADFDTGQGVGTAAGNGPADALALAWRLRALATVLRALLPPDDLSGDAEVHVGSARALRCRESDVALLFAVSGCWRPSAPDTS